MYISWVKPKFWFEFRQLFVKQSSIYIYIYIYMKNTVSELLPLITFRKIELLLTYIYIYIFGLSPKVCLCVCNM